MNLEEAGRRAAHTITHPVILRGAWLRVDAWYKRELAPQPEYSRWRLDPEANLRELARTIREDGWKPERWRQVPYPKKGARLRHYTMPTVRDQVAFMAHMVALGPIIDQQTANFAYGNRWYRPIAWDRRSVPAQWVNRPYPVLTEQIYLPYGRSHGLFRRVAHWTVARMTSAPLPEEGDSSRPPLPSDYEKPVLPKWTREDWWTGSGDLSRAFWAALDIELAYPSIRIARLGDAMETALRRPVELHGLFSGCPEEVLEELDVEDVRVAIGRRLTKALSEITLDTVGIPFDAWGPPKNHPLPRLAAEPYEGIPTGLAISGLLLNVALLEADQAIGRYLDQTSGERRGAIVRFADDMYVLSKSAGGLLSLVEAVHGALSGGETTLLATPNEASNICINFMKIKPDAVREVIGTYLRASGWTPCKECDQPLPLLESKRPVAKVVDWWSIESSRDQFSALREAVERTAIEKGNVGPFITTLVERLSDMGTDTLRQRFGEGARDYLARLHELARFDIEDEQVRPDTRRAFSVNRLVRAWLPKSRETGEEHRELRRIRETIGFVLDRTPWKLAIWRAVVRSASRRPLVESEGTRETAHEASEWLIDQLRRIASSTDSRNSASWLNAWPETSEDDGHANDRTGVWREFYLSFLRASFWRSLGEALSQLNRHAARVGDENHEWAPSPILWTARAIPDGGHPEVAASLGQIDKWVDVLYPASSDVDIAAWPWELEEFVAAVLAVHPTAELADAWRRSGTPGRVLRIPATQRLEEMPRTTALLSKFERLIQIGKRRSWKLDYWALANVQLGHKDNKLGGVLFPAADRSRIRRATNDPRGVVAAGIALGCFEWIGALWATKAVASMEGGLAVLRDGFALNDYARARRLIVKQLPEPTTRPTIHRLLWGAPDAAPLDDWQMAPWETPALGLPSRVAAALFSVAQKKSTPRNWTPSQGPLNWLVDDVAGVLGRGRCRQFNFSQDNKTGEQTVTMSKATEWEVMPHEAFYLPFLSSSSGALHAPSYALYCDVLLLLTALDGAEGILNNLAERGVGGTPFMDRWAWRSRIHLPLAAWDSIEQVLRWSESPGTDVTPFGYYLVTSLARWSSDVVYWADFLPERIDIGLVSQQDLEIVRTIRPAGDLVGPQLPSQLQVSNGSLIDDLVVRVGQVTAGPKPAEVVARFPSISSAVANAMIEQVSDVFLAPAQSGDSASQHLVVLPELAVPQQEVRSLRDLVRKEGKAAVAGLYWRALRPAFRPTRGFMPRWKYFVNEAELIIPVGNDRGPPNLRWFRVRKPVPAHVEDGLAQALSKGAPRMKWRILSGQRWYRFVHPNWGDFTVAICADLIDAAPWRALRGELLHLLMVAFNKDVDLFESLTWVRAYENYVNVASVNHGQYGGSFVWTPRRTHGRELARLRGGELVLTADVQLPVKELFQAQKTGVVEAVKQSSKLWQRTKPTPTQFKSPPPGFRRKQ